MLIILSCRYLKSGTCRKGLSLNIPYLPKDRSPKKNSVVINGLLRVSSTRKDCLLLQERRLEVNTTSRQTLSQTIIPPTYSSTKPIHLTPKTFILPQEAYISTLLSTLRWYVSPNSKASQEVTHFSLWYAC